MKKMLLLLSVGILLYSCGQKQFNELSNEEKENVIVDNVRKYIKDNKSQIVFKNYDFLLEQSNKLMPCPVKPFKKINVLFQETIIVETSLGILSAYEYLNKDEQYGELELYGISFEIDGITGKIDTCYAYASFVQWGKGEIGSRKNLGSDFVNYKEETPNFKIKYGNKELLQKVDDFFEKEMKQKQINNKDKCN